MQLSRTIKVLIGIVLLLLLIIWVIPNIFDQREEEYFSNDVRIDKAKKITMSQNTLDTITVIPGEFYKQSPIHEWFLGRSYRQIWQIPVKVPILRLSKNKGGLDTVKFSGSQQTIGIDVVDKKGRRWAIRSVNKDQSKALHTMLQNTVLRPLFRDQAAALNPYGALAVPVLAKAIGVHHTNPKIYYFPYNPKYGTYNERMAGRLVLMEEEADESWAQTPEFNFAIDLMDTEDMQKTAKEKNIPVDTLLYARSRLLDMLISDWDRHEGNWEWALVEKNGKQVFQPIPVDRDMAFYKFNGGMINKFVLKFNSKFQSYRSEFDNVEGLAVQAEKLDKAILRPLTKEEFIHQAFIQQQLTDEIINKAFLQYPPEVHRVLGNKHEQVLKSRLKALPEAAGKFYQHLQKN